MRYKNLLNETLKEISRYLNVTIEQAKEIKGLINYDINPDKYASVQEWFSQCYNVPSLDERVQEALNEIMEGYGTEPITDENDYVDSFYFDIVFIYINKGDTYKGTIFFDTKREKYFLSCFGDVIERAGL